MKNRANIVVGALVAVVVVAAVGVYTFMQAGAGAGAGAGSDGAFHLRALVHDADGVTHEFALDQNAEKAITTSLGTNVVVIEHGSVYVREADCGNQDCVHQGKIDSPGRQVICLPHKLWIEVVAGGQQGGEMDTAAVAGTSDSSLDAVAR